MKCERCGKEDATLKVTRVEKTGQAFQICVCSGCAVDISPYQKKIAQKSASFDTLLKELLKSQGAKVPDADDTGVIVRSAPAPCPSCGLEWAAYKSTFMLGCPDCYDSFAEVLEQDLLRYHRATRHVEPAPAGATSVVAMQDRLKACREELKNALDYEDYRQAAFLRDEIAKIEAELREAASNAETPTT